MAIKKDLNAIALSQLPEATDTLGYWILGSKVNAGGNIESVKYSLGKLVRELEQTLQLERRMSYTIQQNPMRIFLAEPTTIYRVEGQNIASLKINGQNIDLDTNISLKIDAKSVVEINVERKLTDPEAFIYIYAKVRIL